MLPKLLVSGQFSLSWSLEHVIEFRVARTSAVPADTFPSDDDGTAATEQSPAPSLDIFHTPTPDLDVVYQTFEDTCTTDRRRRHAFRRHRRSRDSPRRRLRSMQAQKVVGFLVSPIRGAAICGFCTLAHVLCLFHDHSERHLRHPNCSGSLGPRVSAGSRTSTGSDAPCTWIMDVDSSIHHDRYWKCPNPHNSPHSHGTVNDWPRTPVKCKISFVDHDMDFWTALCCRKNRRAPGGLVRIRLTRGQRRQGSDRQPTPRFGVIRALTFGAKPRSGQKRTAVALSLASRCKPQRFRSEAGNPL